MAGRPHKGNYPIKGWIPDGSIVKKYEWTIIGQEIDDTKKRHKLIYIAKCSCGNVCKVTADSIRSGQSKRCNNCAKKKSGETRRKHNAELRRAAEEL
jgi:hypothetical protein